MNNISRVISGMTVAVTLTTVLFSEGAKPVLRTEPVPRIERPAPDPKAVQRRSSRPIVPPVIKVPPGSGAVEQTSMGNRPPAKLVESFDGLGVGFKGPQGT
jgi:hypothetical protein